MLNNCIECIVIIENNHPLFIFSTPFVNLTGLYQTLLSYFMGIQRQLFSHRILHYFASHYMAVDICLYPPLSSSMGCQDAESIQKMGASRFGITVFSVSNSFSTTAYIIWH